MKNVREALRKAWKAALLFAAAVLALTACGGQMKGVSGAGSSSDGYWDIIIEDITSDSGSAQSEEAPQEASDATSDYYVGSTEHDDDEESYGLWDDTPWTGDMSDSEPYRDEDSEEVEYSEQDGAEVEEDGEYTSKEEVAAYIHKYGHLPSNYITKKKAESLGWVASKGNLAEVAPGKSIGGSYFGNYEGLLPDGDYRECDIDYVSGRRNAKRIIYSTDGRIYYTEDHYQTFEQLY